MYSTLSNHGGKKRERLEKYGEGLMMKAKQGLLHRPIEERRPKQSAL